MADQPDALPDEPGGFMSRLTLPMLALVGVVVAAGVGGGGFYAYQTYDYVQHDNDFCMSCHLMAEPYELFAQSAHRGLGCKACHQPTLMARSQMALTQVIENPEEISAHAEVPNARCTECHVDGDPEKWRVIANSAGHKAHLESDDPALDGLSCVECHSTSVHEFAPIDRTCGQSQCHADTEIQLGGMSDLTIHCAACHSFVAPVATDTDVIGGERTGIDMAILPDQGECLSCHVMRTLVELPDPDPHRGVCAACHNPHVQSDPSEAGQSCARSGCHTDADELTAFHRGMQPGVLEDCMYCHQAHDFSVDGARCLDCHEGINEDRPTLAPRRGGTTTADTVPVGVSSSAFAPQDPAVGSAVHDPILGAGIGWWTHAPQDQEGPTFRHSQHRSVECGSCHVSAEEHGGLAVRTLNDCRACHHTAPVSNSCGSCHDSDDAPSATFQQTVAVSFSVGAPDQSREMTFPHEPHGVLPCGMCHTEGVRLVAVDVDCASCHAIHHRPDNDCASCHEAAPVDAHPPSEAHVTCSGAACHQDVPFESVPRTRTVCLGCHQDRRDHNPNRVCAECHTLPAPRADG
jgi:nitrate/TMAO reductase-like tetraheme cytochrome c subunit